MNTHGTSWENYIGIEGRMTLLGLVSVGDFWERVFSQLHQDWGILQQHIGRDPFFFRDIIAIFAVFSMGWFEGRANRKDAVVSVTKVRVHLPFT